MRTLTLLTYLFALAAVGSSQEPAKAQPPKAGLTALQENPLSAHARRTYRSYKKILLRAVEKMPEENYNFKPTDTVRSFGQIVAHIAESQYFQCSQVLGEKSPAPKIERTKTLKADLIAALNDAFAYCDKAYDGMTDASAHEMVKFMGTAVTGTPATQFQVDTPKLGVLYGNITHTMRHYGNLVTYMRLKNVVPPTSDPEFMQQVIQQLNK